MEEKNELTFRTLKANEIECRVGNTVKEKDQYGKVVKDQNGNDKVKAFFLLLYKNARVDQTILDEAVGQWNWQCKYYQVKNTMVCSVGIYNEERKEWLWKDNGGDDDFNTEQVKAELSDSFKRACFNWGIGRELYYSPKIYIECKDGNDQYAHYSVKVIEYDESKRITNLAIINDKTKEVVFRYGKEQKVSENVENAPKNAGVTQPATQENEEKGSIDGKDLEIIEKYVEALDREESRKNFYVWLEKKCGTMNPQLLTKSQGTKVAAVLTGRKQ